jgi:hypothetical protein
VTQRQKIQSPYRAETRVAWRAVVVEPVDCRHGVCGQVPLREHDSLRLTGGARRIQDRGHIIGRGTLQSRVANFPGIDGRRLLNHVLEPLYRLAGKLLLARIVADEVPHARQRRLLTDELGCLGGAGKDDELRAAVLDLPGDLRAGQRRVHRHLNAAGKLDRQVGDDPLVTILGDVDDAVARLDAELHEQRRPVIHLSGQLLPSALEKGIVGPLRQEQVLGIQSQTAVGPVRLGAERVKNRGSLSGREHVCRSSFIPVPTVPARAPRKRTRRTRCRR